MKEGVTFRGILLASFSATILRVFYEFLFLRVDRNYGKDISKKSGDCSTQLEMRSPHGNGRLNLGWSDFPPRKHLLGCPLDAPIFQRFGPLNNGTRGYAHFSE